MDKQVRTIYESMLGVNREIMIIEFATINEPLREPRWMPIEKHCREILREMCNG